MNYKFSRVCQNSASICELDQKKSNSLAVFHQNPSFANRTHDILAYVSHENIKTNGKHDRIARKCDSLLTRRSPMQTSMFVYLYIYTFVHLPLIKYSCTFSEEQSITTRMMSSEKLKANKEHLFIC